MDTRVQVNMTTVRLVFISRRSYGFGRGRSGFSDTEVKLTEQQRQGRSESPGGLWYERALILSKLIATLDHTAITISMLTSRQNP